MSVNITPLLRTSMTHPTSVSTAMSLHGSSRYHLTGLHSSADHRSHYFFSSLHSMILSFSFFHKSSPTSEPLYMLFPLPGELFLGPPPQCYIRRNACPETLFKVVHLLLSSIGFYPKLLFSTILHISLCIFLFATTSLP